MNVCMKKIHWDFLINPLVLKVKALHRNSTHINILDGITHLLDNLTLCTLDVSSLYNIPYQEVIKAI